MISLLAACQTNTSSIQIAVASNFAATLGKISSRFTAQTGTKIQASSASTGQLYAQILAGAPFDVFLSADAKRPAELIAAGLGVAESRFVYARGQLVLWSTDPKRVDAEGKVLSRVDLGVIAVADPRTAPYGATAQALLRARGLWGPLSHSGRIATAGSVTQAYQFVASGSASMGFVALSQVLAGQNQGDTGSYFRVPTASSELNQEAVLLTRAAGNREARAFLEFLRHDQLTRQLIQRDGYALP